MVMQAAPINPGARPADAVPITPVSSVTAGVTATSVTAGVTGSTAPAAAAPAAPAAPVAPVAPVAPAAPVAPVAPAAPSAPAALAPAPVAMDRDFIARNQIVERYIAGRLPLKGAQDFERYCREHPDLIDELGLTERINAALRLLDASGRASPWEERPKAWWQQLPALLGTAALALVLGIATLVMAGKLAARQRSIALLQQRVAQQPLDPAQSTHTLVVIPSRTAPSLHSLATLGNGAAELADLKFDVSWSQYPVFRVTIDRIDQGRVAILHNVQRDSNGQLHLEFNTSALGPGDYQLAMEGMTWRGEPIPQAWATISIVH
jgi:hypothetical protein